MSFQPPFRFSLKKDDNTWYYWDIANGLMTDNAAHHLVNSPKEWSSVDRSWGRSNTYYALFRAIGTGFEFVGDGAKILRYLDYNGSMETIVIFVIEKFDANTTSYSIDFVGDVDLSKINDNRIESGAESVKETVLQGGVAAALTTNETVPYEIPIDPSDPNIVSVLMDGIQLRGQYDYIFGSFDLGSNQGIGFTNQFSLPIIYSTREGDYPIATTGNETAYQFGAAGGPINVGLLGAPLPVYTQLGSTNGSVLAHFGYQNTISYAKLTTGSGVADVQLRISAVLVADGSNIEYARTLLWADTGSATSTTLRNVNIFIDPTTNGVNINQGDKVFIIYSFHPTSSFTQTNPQYRVIQGQYSLPTSYLNIQIDFSLPPTVVYGYRYYYFLQLLFAKITGISNVLSSPWLSSALTKYLDSRPYNTIVTCGDALRGLTTNASGVPTLPTIKTTLQEAAHDFITQWQLGLAVENEKVVIAPLADFFDQNTIISDLQEPSTFSCIVANDYVFQLGNWGYKPQTYDGLNGKDEYNNTSTFKYPLTKAPNTDDGVSDYRTDMYGIEQIRANLSNKTTTDSSSDNDTFIVAISDDFVSIVNKLITLGGYKLNRPNNTASNINGVLFPATAYNIELSPLHKLLRNGPRIHSGLYNRDDQSLIFQTTDKNSALVSNLGGNIYVESGNIPVLDLGNQIWKPKMFNITVPSHSSLTQLMGTSPRGCFRFPYKGNLYKGYPVKVGAKGAYPDTYEMSLLCTADTDLTKLAD